MNDFTTNRKSSNLLRKFQISWIKIYLQTDLKEEIKILKNSRARKELFHQIEHHSYFINKLKLGVNESENLNQSPWANNDPKVNSKWKLTLAKF